MPRYVTMRINNKISDVESPNSFDVYLKERDGFTLVCECPTKASAILIAKALNSHGPAIRTRKVKKIESLLTPKDKDKTK